MPRRCGQLPRFEIRVRPHREGFHEPQLLVLVGLFEAIPDRPVLAVGRHVVDGRSEGFGFVFRFVFRFGFVVVLRFRGICQHDQISAVGRPPVGADAACDVGHRPRLGSVERIDPDLGGIVVGADETQRTVGPPARAAHAVVGEGELPRPAVLDVGQPQPGDTLVVLQAAARVQPGHLGTVRGDRRRKDDGHFQEAGEGEIGRVLRCRPGGEPRRLHDQEKNTPNKDSAHLVTHGVYNHRRPPLRLIPVNINAVLIPDFRELCYDYQEGGHPGFYHKTARHV